MKCGHCGASISDDQDVVHGDDSGASLCEPCFRTHCRNQMRAMALEGKSTFFGNEQILEQLGTTFE